MSSRSAVTVFGADTTDGDKLSWLNSQREKLLESEVLAQQAANNTKEQFASSPDLTRVFIDALIDSHSAQSNLSLQALNSEQPRHVPSHTQGRAHRWAAP